MSSTEFKSRWAEVNAQMQQSVTSGLKRAADEMKFQMIGEMNSPKSGRRYPRQGGFHIASAPGQAPATDYGALEASIEIVEESPTRIAVQSNEKKAVVLEYGGRFIAPRPLWVPAAERIAESSGQTILTEIQKAVK